MGGLVFCIPGRRQLRFTFQFYHIGSLSASFFIHIGIMLSGRIDVLVSQHGCHQINIPRFLIKRRTIGAAKLMGSDFL